jgi:hypothetical protein
MREKQIRLPMWKMKAKVSRGRAQPARRSAPELARQSDQGRPDGVTSSQLRSQEIIVSRVRRFSPWLLGALAAASVVPASGQNLDAGKPASQIFAEVCANCHRSPREFKSNPGASFLREHYTTGADMASTMAAYLAAGSDPRGAAQPKRPPTNLPAPAVTTTPKDAPATTDPSRDPRRAQQTADPKADPKASPAQPPGLTRNRPGTARADGTADAKPPAPPAPVRPVLEDFEE